MKIHECLDLNLKRDLISCNDCGYQLYNANENYKRHCVMGTRPITEVRPEFESRVELLGDEHNVEFRRFYCQSCAVPIAYETGHAKGLDTVGSKSTQQQFGVSDRAEQSPIIANDVFQLRLVDILKCSTRNRPFVDFVRAVNNAELSNTLIEVR